MTTLEEARKCPKCGQLMELDGGTPSPEDRKILTYAAICRTELCIWFGTGRAITMVDGVVYERPSGGRGQAKQFPILTPDQLAFGQRNVEDAVQRDLRDSETPKGPQD